MTKIYESTPPRNVAFLGLGVMGFPMAGHLASAGHRVTVYNRTASKAAEWVMQHGGASAPTPAAAAEGADLVFACVGNDDDLRAVTTGSDGAFALMSKGAIFVDHTTASASVARGLAAEAARLGFAFVDAPVTGGTPRAANGTLTIIASGDANAIDMARPAFAVIGSNVFIAGPQPGQAQMVKLVNNMLNYLAMAATAEALVVGVKAGLDPQLMLDVLNTGTGKNSATEVKFPKAVLPRTFNYGATNTTVDKDLLLFLDEAERMKLPAPIARNLSDLWHGWAKEHPSDDITTITKMYEHWAGVEVRGRPG